MICPQECEENKTAASLIEKLVAQPNPIEEVCYVDLRESMRNGGGPACLRLRVVLNEEEEKHLHPGFILNKEKYGRLGKWIEKFYREELKVDELRDYQLLKECYTALDELTQLFHLGSIYDFQK